MSTTKYFSSAGMSSMLSFDLSMGSLNLEGSTITYRGSNSVDRVFVGSGLTFDFIQSLGGMDRLYFNGLLSDFSLSVSGSVLTLTRASDNTVVLVNGASVATTLLFLDGSVSANALRQHALGNIPAPIPTGQTSSPHSVDVIPNEPNGPNAIQAFATGVGAVFGTVPMGAAMQLRGSSGVETVYVKGGSQVDATQLLGGTDKIYVTGLLSEYSLNLTGSVVTLTRPYDTYTESVRVISGDSLIFADGTVSTTSLINALRNGTALPVPAGERTPGVPIPQSVNIISDAGPDGYYQAGDMVQITVTFSETVLVSGTPMLQLNVGGDLRNAVYDSGDGTNTLTFSYFIGADNDANGISIDMAALVLNGAVIRTVQGERAVTLTPAVTDQINHKVDTDAPNAPVIAVVAVDDVITEFERPGSTVHGTAEANAVVDIAFSSGMTRQVVTNGSGNWSYSLTAADFITMGVGSETVTVTARDAAGNLSLDSQRTFSITALDLTAPQITGPSGGAGSATSAIALPENGTAVHTFMANEAVTWSLSGGVDAARFAIHPTTGALQFLAASNYEAPNDNGADNVYVVMVRATDPSGNSSEQTVTVTVTNVNEPYTGGVVVAGTPLQGRTLLVNNTLADPDGIVGAISYQWRANGVDIGGATGNAFVLGQNEVGKNITVMASYTDGSGALVNVLSNSTMSVANANDAPTGSVSIGGTVSQGQTLTATNTLADLDGMGAVSYQWRADGVNIGGATSNTLLLNQTHVGKVITVVASYTDGYGAAESVSSSATVAVANVNDAPVLADTSLSMGVVERHLGGPVGAVGVLLSSLTGGISDLDVGAVKGIAITGTNAAQGTLYYSTNGGTNWTQVGSVSDVNALLLADNANTRLYYDPIAGDSMVVSDILTFKAWDQTSGTAGTKVNASGTGGSTAFSTATDTVGATLQIASTVDLGAGNGRLVAPVMVEGKLYYVWDVNNDGVHGAGDTVTHMTLDGIFRYDVNGVQETAGNAVGLVGDTDNTFRYALLNNILVALPTYGSSLSGVNASPINLYKNGTAVNSGSVNNPTYDDLLAIWDAHNGSGTGTGTAGIPPGWNGNDYWSATPSAWGHAFVSLDIGYVLDVADTNSYYVALQVL